MKVLLIKTSSLGDIIHTLPALSDARRANPDIHFDWIAEEGFVEIPSWHPAVDRVIPIALRRWRKSPVKTWRGHEFRQFREQLAATRYDLIIDAQGLLKSAWLTRLNAAPSAGYDAASIREPLASRFYQNTFTISRSLHAVERVRQLFAASLGYARPDTPPNYGLELPAEAFLPKPYVFLLHGTTWETKHYPETFWGDVCGHLLRQGLTPVVTWGNDSERQRALRLVDKGAVMLERTSLRQLAAYLRGASGAISVDTGLGHLATALDVPLIGVYGPTNPDLSGIYGARQQSLKATYHCAPCMKKTCRYACLGIEPPCWSALPPEQVVQSFNALPRLASSCAQPSADAP
jgi:heptosyltransferase-1